MMNNLYRFGRLFLLGLLIGLVAVFLVSLLASCQPPKNGKDGTFCTVHRDVNGASISCSDGTYAKVMDGNDGIPGLDAAQIFTMQFCPGYTTVYPTVFAEVGLCINNQLYGVYYAPPSAGLVLLPPGYYASTQTSAPCNFNIGLNCVVY